METFQTSWTAPSNIALIKYWGKKSGQLPQNPSLSFSLSNARTITEVSASLSEEFAIKFEFEGEENPKFLNRIKKVFERWSLDIPEIKKFKFFIKSKNTFPHSAGIASSASSMAALALCMTEFENNFRPLENFHERASYFARLASGSASRSIFPGYAIWGEVYQLNTSNFYASPIEVHENFKDICDTVLIVSSGEKSVSSSLGHQLMDYHPYASIRYEVARENLRNLHQSLQLGDWNTFGEIVELEAMNLHALMITSNPSILLLRPESLEIISKIKELRVLYKLNLYFTIDAGPNIHLIYPLKEKIIVDELINMHLKQLTEKIIDDHIGDGPHKIC